MEREYSNFHNFLEFAEYAEYDEDNLEVRSGTPPDTTEGAGHAITRLDRQKYVNIGAKSKHSI